MSSTHSKFKRPPHDSVDSAHAKLVRSTQSQRRYNTYSRGGHRLRQLERLIRERHGKVPDTDDADVYLFPVARCFRKILVDKAKPATADKVTTPFSYWCERLAPHLAANQIADIVHQVLDEPYFDRDDDLAAALRLSYAERQRLKITTIGSYDVDRRVRKRLNRDRKRERDRLRAAEKRRANGATPWATYQANSLAQTKPWEQMGISRRTYYRRMANGTNASPHPSISTGDGIVPQGECSPAACDGRQEAAALRPERRLAGAALGVPNKPRIRIADEGRGKVREASGNLPNQIGGVSA